jgi:hypothetical protein
MSMGILLYIPANAGLLDLNNYIVWVLDLRDGDVSNGDMLDCFKDEREIAFS